MTDDKIKELLDLAYQFSQLVDKTVKGDIGLGSLALLLSTLEKVAPAIQDAQAALTQYESMDDATAMDLENYVSTQYGATPDKVQSVIELSLKTLIELHTLVQLFVKPAPQPAA